MFTKQKTKMIATAIVLCTVAGAANATGNKGWFWNWCNPPGQHEITAPEIDPASASSALTLLMGGLMLLRNRTRTRKNK